MKKILLLYLMMSAIVSFGQPPNELTPEEKIYGLSKFWQEVNYNFIFLDKIDRTVWDDLYKTYLKKVIETENDYEYYRLLQRFCAFLNDGHTNVYFPKHIKDHVLVTNFGDYILHLSNIEGKAIITKVNASKAKEIPMGTEIIKVNGIPTDRYLSEEVFPYIASSTDYIREDWGIHQMLAGYVGTSYDLELKLPNGSLTSLRLTHSNSAEEIMHPPAEKLEMLNLHWYPNNLAYLTLNTFAVPQIVVTFKEKLPELKKAQALIIDLRGNGGGNTDIGRDIFIHLTNDTILYGSKTQSRMHIPTFKAWGKWTQEKDTINNPSAKQNYLAYRDAAYYDFPYSPYNLSVAEKDFLKSTRIVVPTVILIGHQTASAAEDFLIYTANQKHMTTIGEPTFASTGQPLMLDLPKGGQARICTKKDTYPDGKEFVGVGIQPDIKISKTLADYMENKDSALEHAIDFLKNKK